MTTHTISSRRIFFVLLLIIAALISYGQTDGQTISISALTGPKIDKFEFNKFRLYDLIATDRKTFDYAKVITKNDQTFKMMIYSSDGNITGYDINERYLKELKEKIRYEGRKLLDMIKQAEDLLAKGEKPELRLSLENGSTLIGNLIAITTEKLEIKSSMGKFSIPFEDLDRLEIAGKDYQSDYRYTFTNPNATRYLFAPSAIPLKKGEGYYQNVWVTLNSVNYGLTDHVSITGGLELISTLTAIFLPGEIGPFAFANVKAGFPVSDKIHLGGGVLAGGLLSDEFEEINMGIAYGLVTRGNEEHNVTLGLGYGMVSGEWARTPIVVLNGMTRLNKRLGLVTENWFISSYDEYKYSDYQTGANITRNYTDVIMALSGGLRIMSEKITIDVALITGGFIEFEKTTNTESGSVERDNYSEWLPIPIPYLDLVYKF